MPIKLLITSLFLFIGFESLAQPPLDWVAASTTGGGFQDYIDDVFVDPAGNTYGCGTFRGSLTIGSDNLFATNAGQAFVVKLDPSGAPLWAIQSNGNSQAFAKSIFVDALGYTYVTGFHSHSVLSFSGLSLPSSSNEGFYVLKISPSGVPIRLNGPTPLTMGKSQAYGIVGDGDYVYIAGSHKASVDLPGVPTLPATAGLSDIFLTRIDSALTSFDYAQSYGGAEDDHPCSITMNGANVFMTGYYGNAPCTFLAPGPDYILPAYGNEAIWVSRHAAASGQTAWVTSAGSAVGDSRGVDITASGIGVFVTGAISDSCTFVATPSTSGPFVYNDTLFSAGQQDIFTARFNLGGSPQSEWREGGIGNDIGNGITLDGSCTEIQICGSFEDSVNFGGTTPLIANGRDMFVLSSNNSGLLNWVFKELSTGDESANAIHSNGGQSSFGGEISSDAYFGTSPLTAVSWNGFNDHFVSSFQCASVAPCGPVITNCLTNDTVVADASCSHVLGDYTSLLTVTDGCAMGITVTQSPPPLNILNAGIHEITLTATDGALNTDVCIFNIMVEADSNPILVECGDKFIGSTTGGSGNTFNSFSCSPISTPGQDNIYQITVTNSNQFLQVKMGNLIDANDPYAYVYWLDASCPNTGACSEVDSMEVASNQFSNNSDYLTFSAPGPGTYFLVVDSKTDSIENFDLEFFCFSSGIEFDGGACNVLDTDSDGIVAYVNASNADLTVQPCESVNICHDIYVANANDWEWMDSVQFELGDCYENINVTTLTPDNPPVDNGFVDGMGEWDASYNLSSNAITWEFTHSSGNPWGDGNTSPYACQLYTFCFDADITAACANNEGLNIGIIIGDDGGKGVAPPSNLFDVGNSNDFILQDDNPFFSYSTTALCNADPDILPDSITTAGGSFTASAGIVFTDGSPSPTGEIDLTASTIGGPYTITYEVGLCPFTFPVIVDIYAQEDPAFNYSAAAYCQNDADPIATITGTVGGTFTANPGVVFIDGSPSPTGQIDLNASTAGGPYWVTYTTPGPNCINLDSVQVTINPEDDSTFTYAMTTYCAAAANELPATIATLGGTFNEYTGNLSINAGTGEVNITGSPVGAYYITYTTSGICPNTDSVQFDILVEDDPAFNYPAIAYCQNETNPVANITGTPGGTFSGPVGVVFQSTLSGEIDLLGSTAGGPYTITYTTPGPDCPNSMTFDITINAEDDSTFAYATNTICLGDTNPVPTISGTSGGTFTATGGLIFTDGPISPTGTIDLTTTPAGGPYIITYTTPGPECPNDLDVTVNVFEEDTATFLYNILTFCSYDTDPIPSITQPGGTFTGPVTFVDNMTGEIDLDASPAGGPHEIVYTTPGPECPNTDTAFVTITQADDPGFDYAASDWCVIDGVISPNITGTAGGTFSTTDTSVDLASNGDIDLANSSAGLLYSIQYLTAGTCPDSSIFMINIFDEPTADAGPDQALFLNYSTDLHAVSATIGTGVWTLVSGTGNLLDPTDSLSEVTDLSAGSNTFTWTVSNGVCPDATDDVTITISDLFIPEALTPNSDGENDFFKINGIDLLENELIIYNRWGQKIYQVVNYQNDWEGLDDNGDELVNDTYFYVLEVEGQTHKGFIVLKR